MKKIVKLTESDLVRIVKKIIDEQSVAGAPGYGVTTPFMTRRKVDTPNTPKKENINPKNLKLGAGGNKNSAQIVDVKKLQQKLIDLKLLDISEPTGYFGSLTQSALDKYNSTETKPTPVSSSPSKPSEKPVDDKVGFLDSMSKFVSRQVTKLRSLGKFAPLPLHIRAFYNFTTLRKNDFTENDMKNTELAALKEMCVYAEKNNYLKSKGATDFYTIANKMNKDSEKINFSDKKTLGLNQGSVKSEFTRIALTIGNAVVTKTNDGRYVITDLYDFNNYARNPEKYNWQNSSETVNKAIEKIGNGNYIQGVEELASYYHKLGYPGYKVKITV